MLFGMKNIHEVVAFCYCHDLTPVLYNIYLKSTTHYDYSS